MISFQKAYVAGDKVYATLEEAQCAEIKRLAADTLGSTSMTVEDWCELIVAQKEAIMNILTTTDRSRPRARKVNGGRKPRNVTKLTQTEMAAQ